MSRLFLIIAIAGATAARLPSAWDLKKHGPAEIERYLAMDAERDGTSAPTDVPPPPAWEAESVLPKEKSRLGRSRVPPPPPLEDLSPRTTKLTKSKPAAPRRIKVPPPPAMVMHAPATVLKRGGGVSVALKAAAGAAATTATPKPPAGAKARHELLASLQRRSLAMREVLPTYTALELKPPADLWERDEVALDALRTSLDTRVDLCGRVLDLHEKLGQSPPTGFRGWKLPEISSYASNLESRMPRLQRAVSLHAQLGQSRVDMSMVSWPEEKLEAHTTSLVAQVEATRARREREQLLGKVEAALWRKDPEAEPPMGLSTMSSSELRRVLAKLNGETAPAPSTSELSQRRTPGRVGLPERES